jgi:hypothetical protein
MLIESYVVSFSEVKRCISSLQIEDFVIVSENIFALTEAAIPPVNDLLSESTPVNHPEALLLVNKDYAHSLIFNGESFDFLKKSHDIKNLDGVSLHLTFANTELIRDMQKLATKKVVDGIFVKCMSHQSLLAIQKVQMQKYQDNRMALLKALSIYTKEVDRQSIANF